jgi:hypothetical protein
MIYLRYRSIDGVSTRKQFTTLKGAREYCHKAIGEHPEIGSHYAVSNDGIGKIIPIQGASLADLFPPERAPFFKKETPTP